MSETPSLLPHIPFLSQYTHQHTLLFHPSKILSDPTKLLPRNLIPEPSKILPNLFSDPSNGLHTDLSNVLSTIFSSLTENPLTFLLGQLLNPEAKLLGLFTFPIPMSLSLRRCLIIGAVVLLLTGLIITGSVLGLIILTPLVIALSPIWLPAGICVVTVAVGFLSVCGFGAVVAVSGAWLAKHFFNL